MIPTDCFDIISGIEADLTGYYGIDNSCSVVDFIQVINCDNQKSRLKEHGVSPSRGATLFKTDKTTLDINVFIPEWVFQSVGDNPANKIDMNSLDAMLILVEEISHFHLIIRKILLKQTFSFLEIEYQGEIDKMILGSMWLERSTGYHQFNKLFEIVHESYTVADTTNKNRYQEATYLAMRFWLNLGLGKLSSNPTLEPDKKRTISLNYFADWHQKLVIAGINQCA